MRTLEDLLSVVGAGTYRSAGRLLAATLTVSAFLATGPLVRAQVSPADFQARSFEGMPYRLFVPKTYDPALKYPLVLFLHGAGERGNDNLSQLTGQTCSMTFAQPASQEAHPAFVLAPQCPYNGWWDRAQLEKVLIVIDRLKLEFSLDPSRIYVTGISMGGFGTYTLMEDFPKMFACAVPICGWGDIAFAPIIKDVPIWIFHGGSDSVVPAYESRNMYAALQAAGAPDVHYTEFPGVGHDSWNLAYATPDLARWMFSKRAPSNRVTILGEQEMPATAIRLSADSHAAGASAKDAYSAWGVRLSSNGSSIPWVKRVNGETPAVTTIVNSSPVGQDAGSAHESLVVSLDRPASAIGLSLVGAPAGGASILASARAFDALGVDLGFAEALISPGSKKFLGIGAPTTGISRLVLDYGAVSKGEEIERLTIQFVDAPVFLQYLPQFADGPTGPDSALQTELQITGLSDGQALVGVYFFDQKGVPLTIPFSDGTSAPSVARNLAAGESLRISSGASAQQVLVGYVAVTSTAPIETTAIYRRVNTANGTTIAETSLRADEPRSLSAAPIDQSADANLVSAIAMVNPSETRANVTLRLRSAPEADWVSKSLTIEPHCHVAKFLTELFPGLQGMIAGTVQCSSDQPLSVVVVRTLAGLPISNISVGSLER